MTGREGTDKNNEFKSDMFCGEAFVTEEVEQEIAAARDRVFAEIHRLNLQSAVAELDMQGFTVIPPELAAPPGFARRVRDALLDAAEADTGIRPNIESGDTHKNFKTRHGQVQHVEPLIHRHPIFQQALLNERALGLVTYLLGESCVLFSNSGQIKGPGYQYLPLHADQASSCTPAPFPAIAQVANAVWVLSDYNAENGAVCLVPGSHRFCRHPTRTEATDLSLFTPLEAKAGSIVVWHGNTWHGAIPRTAPGLRTSIIQYFGRWYQNPGDAFAKLLSSEDIARNPPRFARLVGANPTPGLDFCMPSNAARFSHFA